MEVDNELAGRRLDGESFEDFKERQKIIREYTKIKLMGEMYWTSCMIMMAEEGQTKKIPVLGTYVKKDAEEQLKKLAHDN